MNLKQTLDKFPDFLNINDQKVSESNKIADILNDLLKLEVAISHSIIF